MATVEYEDAKVKGGVAVFDDVVAPDRAAAEPGSEPIPSPEAAERYAETVESIRNSQQAGETAIADLALL